MSDSALMLIDETTSLNDVKTLKNLVLGIRNDVFVEDVDFGVIPGTNKPTLLKPGMEKLLRALQLRPEYVPLDCIQDFDKPLFFYRYECKLVHITTGFVVATSIGSANSREAKWGYRWVKAHDVPAELDKAALRSRGGKVSEFAFAIENAETEGQYGKPQVYWDSWKTAIESGLAIKTTRKTKNNKELDAWEMSAVEYRIPNEDIFDITNTIDKMAQKRALGSAVQIAANVSEFYTVDIEDMERYDIVDGSFTEIVKNGSGGGKSGETTTTGDKPPVTTQKGKEGHFLATEEGRGKFLEWATTGKTIKAFDKLQESDVLEALKVENLVDFKGSKTSAMSHMIAYFCGYEVEEIDKFCEANLTDAKDEVKELATFMAIEAAGDLSNAKDVDF